MGRHYRFPYCLVKKPIYVTLGHPQLFARWDPNISICKDNQADQGEQLFSQIHKLDVMGRKILESKILVNQITIEDDMLYFQVNTPHVRQEWKKVENIISNVFCLPIVAEKR